MKVVLVIVFSFISFLSFSQIGGEDEVYLGGDLVDAQFQGGGLEKFYSFIVENYDLTKIEKKGQIIFTFNVNEEGKVKNIKILQDLGTKSALELIRVIVLAPNWTPAKRAGKPVSISLKMPITIN